MEFDYVGTESDPVSTVDRVPTIRELAGHSCETCLRITRKGTSFDVRETFLAFSTNVTRSARIWTPVSETLCTETKGTERVKRTRKYRDEKIVTRGGSARRLIGSYSEAFWSRKKSKGREKNSLGSLLSDERAERASTRLFVRSWA